ncbi:MAG TPA: hypothetical protein VGG40_10510 [Solirubrobacterales bacterium]|jgi:hypothetical protein
MRRLRSAYGDSPLHLLAVLASFAVAGYGFFRIVESPSALGTFAWFAGAIVAHDLIAFPLYSALNLIAYRSLAGSGAARESTRRVPLVNHVRIPIGLAALALLMFFPLVLGLDSRNYERDARIGTGVFLDRWLGLCAALLVGSALLYAVRLRIAGRRPDEAGETEAG